MCCAKAQSSPSQSATPMVGESMTAPMLRTWVSSAAVRGDQASPPCHWMKPPLPTHTSRPSPDRGAVNQHSPLPQPTFLHLQEATRSPFIAAQRLRAVATSHRSRMAMRSRSCEGDQESRAAKQCHRGISCHPTLLTAPPTGRDKTLQGQVHWQ